MLVGCNCFYYTACWVQLAEVWVLPLDVLLPPPCKVAAVNSEPPQTRELPRQLPQCVVWHGATQLQRRHLLQVPSVARQPVAAADICTLAPQHGERHNLSEQADLAVATFSCMLNKESISTAQTPAKHVTRR